MFVITLGFEEKFAVRMITRHGLDEGDKLLLVTGPPTRQAERAIKFLRDFASKYYGGRVSVEVVETHPQWGFDSLVAEVYKAVATRLGEGRVVFNLSGGMRCICLAALVAAQLLSLSGAQISVELETEDSELLLEVPHYVLALPRVVAELTPEKAALLSRIAAHRTTISKLAEKVGKDVSTVARHLRVLQRLGLVKVSGARPRIYEITPIAKILLQALRLTSKVQ